MGLGETAHGVKTGGLSGAGLTQRPAQQCLPVAPPIEDADDGDHRFPDEPSDRYSTPENRRAQARPQVIAGRAPSGKHVKPMALRNNRVHKLDATNGEPSWAI